MTNAIRPVPQRARANACLAACPARAVVPALAVRVLVSAFAKQAASSRAARSRSDGGGDA